MRGLIPGMVDEPRRGGGGAVAADWSVSLPGRFGVGQGWESCLHDHRPLTAHSVLGGAIPCRESKRHLTIEIGEGQAEKSAILGLDCMPLGSHLPKKASSSPAFRSFLPAVLIPVPSVSSAAPRPSHLSLLPPECSLLFSCLHIERFRFGCSRHPQDSHASLPGPKPEDLMVFTRPSLKSDFTDSGFRWGTAPEHVKGWISSGFCARVRADKGVLKEALPEIRHQLLSGWWDPALLRWVCLSGNSACLMCHVTNPPSLPILLPPWFPLCALPPLQYLTHHIPPSCLSSDSVPAPKRLCRSTGAPVYNSMLFIDPVNGHSHTPVYPPYDSDDEDAILAVNQQIARMKELSSKIQRSKLEDREIQKKLAALTTKTQEVSEAVDETSSVGSYRSS